MLSLVSILDVAERCGIRIGRNTGKPEVRVSCPFCGDHRRSMSLNTEKNVFYCHHCGERGNGVSLYSKLVGADTRTVYRELGGDKVA